MTFRQHALTCIRELAETRDEFTSDDLYPMLQIEPSEPNQVGSVFREAAKLGIIKSTERFVFSQRPAAKHRRIQVWSAKVGAALW